MSRARAIEFVVAASQEGSRLDTAIAEGGHGLSRSQVKSLITKGLVLVDGKAPAKAGVELAAGARVRINIPEPEKLELAPREVGLTILYEDDALAVLEKPAGISVHPSHTEKGATVVHGLLAKLSSLSSVGGVERPGIVHRIDKGTSGVLVVSKTDAAHLGLSRQFKEHTIDRRYLALVYGDVARAKKVTQATIETFFGRNPANRKKMTGRLTEGRRAITHWRVLETFNLERSTPQGGCRSGPGLTLVECRLETGRTHQIRVHLSELGYPLVGDPLYGDNERLARALPKGAAALAKACAALDHQLLHAFRLGFAHPVTGKAMLFESEPPADFARILALARGKRQG